MNNRATMHPVMQKLFNLIELEPTEDKKIIDERVSQAKALIAIIKSNKDINIDTQNQYDDTLLIRAVYHNYPEIVDELISMGCNLNIQNVDKRTALFVAA